MGFTRRFPVCWQGRLHRCVGERDGGLSGKPTLVCGNSSVTLYSDGRVIVKGAELLTRATGTNRIRGASVQIN